MSAILLWLHRGMLAFCTALVIVIIGALSVQIISRYVFNAPVHMTDDIAEISLIWLTFIGAALVYREKGHIGVEVVTNLESLRIRQAIHIGQHVLVAVLMVYVLTQVRQLEPLMSRLEFGTVPRGPLTSKFMLILLPFGIGAAMTIVFALEGIWREAIGRPLPKVGSQE